MDGRVCAWFDCFECAIELLGTRSVLRVFLAHGTFVERPGSGQERTSWKRRVRGAWELLEPQFDASMETMLPFFHQPVSQKKPVLCCTCLTNKPRVGWVGVCSC